jgi:hypothetical protein
MNKQFFENPTNQNDHLLDPTQILNLDDQTI